MSERRSSAVENQALTARIRSVFGSSRLSRVADKSWRMIPAIFLVALMLRASFALTLPEQLIWEDGARYEKVAASLLTAHAFGSLEDNRFSVPLQPLLIAGVYTVFGQSRSAARLVWALLGAATCVLAYLLGRALANPVVGLLAGGGVAVYPYYVYLNTMFEYPQTVFIFLMALCFLGLIRFASSRRWLTLLGASLCLGGAILSVPTALLFLPFILLWLRSQLHPRPALMAGVFLVLLGALGPVMAWTYRNYLAYDRVILINCAGGVNFWKGNNATYAAYGKAGTELEEGQTPDPKHLFLTEFGQVQHSVAALGPIDSWIELDRIGWRRGLAFIEQDPGRFLTLTIRKFLHLWSPYPDAVSQNGQITPTRTAIAVITCGPILVLGILGMMLGLRDWRRFRLVYAYIGVLTVTYSLVLPTTRYRLPIDFFLILFAAIFVDALIRLWPRRAAAEAHPVALSVTRS